MNRRSIKFRITASSAVLFVLLLVSEALSADSASRGIYSFPSKQQIITFLTETIEWYRYSSVERQIANEPFDLLLFDDSQPIGAQIVQLSFDVARAGASLTAKPPVSPQAAANANAFSSNPQQVVQMEAKCEAEITQATQDLDSIKTRLLRARSADRKKLAAALADAQSRLALLQQRFKSLRKLVEFAQANDVSRPQTADLDHL